VVPRPVPDPACETAIIRAFLSYGFHVVDQEQVKFLRMTDRYVLQHASEDTVFETRICLYHRATVFLNEANKTETTAISWRGNAS